MESLKRRTPKRKPLSECTNTIRNSTKPLLLKPSKFLPSSTFKIPHHNYNPNLNNISLISKSNTSVGSNNHINTSEDGDVSPSDMPSNPCPPTTTSGECSTVYTRRRAAAENMKEKGKMVVVPMSCPPVERNLNFREVANGVDNVGLSNSCVVPRKKKPRQLPSKKEEIVQLKDYIDQQRAYFAEIDAFELEEEVASESELE